MEVGFFVLFVFLPLSLAADDSDRCRGRGTFQLSLFGSKQDDDKWNTTYDLDRYSCNSGMHWSLVLFQNVTEYGDMRRIRLRGFFTDSKQDSAVTGSNPFSFDRIQTGSPEKTALDYGESWKGSKFDCERKMRVVPRSEWKARRATNLINALEHPVKSLHFYQRNNSCSTPKDCASEMRKIQEREMPSRGDIFANFVSAGDGRVYEGVGWDRSMDSELNFKYLTIGSNPPSPQQLASMALLLREGVAAGKVSERHRLSGTAADMTKKWLTWAYNL